MTNEHRQSRAVDGKGRTIRELLSAHKYSIDYYQREYKWKTKQVTELIDDLSGKFLESHEPGNERSAVAEYGHYFLGSVIISDKDGEKFIIDGQQRLTTLTLLLIFLQQRLNDTDQKGQISDLIFAQKFGKRSFNLNVPERSACMDALYNGEHFDENGQSESVVNILARYADIEENFPEELLGETLPYFVDWLIENVHLVEITAYSDDDAYTIFETMNDRGLSLAPADMLKGYLLANIDEQNRRNSASQVWKERIGALLDIGKDEGADGIKSWLRSQYAETIRERKRGAVPKDFDLIGTEFHRWVRDHERELHLKKSDDFSRFIEREFAFYGRWYERLRNAAEEITPGLESVHFNAQLNFTLQYPVLLAPLRRSVPKFRLVKEYGRSLRLDDEAERKLLARSEQPLRDVIILMRDTGMRNERELYRTRIENIDWNDRVIFVPDSKTPNGRRLVPMTDRVVDILLVRCGVRREGWVFPSKRSKSGHIITLAKRFREARTKAGLSESLVLYCGRHDYGTRVLRETGNLAAVMKTMGHRDVKTAMQYQHPELEIVRQALNHNPASY